HDIDTTTSPIEGNLSWAIQKSRRTNGLRAGGFPGATRIFAELAQGPSRLRIGLLPEGRAPMRDGTQLFAEAEGGEAIGHITSGGFGPSLGAPISMGYLPAALCAAGTTVYAEVRGKRLPATVAAMPFQPTTYKR
ncbi:MAG: glycine cleavage system aminomethyltransferase GcvT, partial [Paracoccaceae bacterium]|nr:glycine cleavage system aminomethyltransferase GcvT [Paracoccaceae bacterium]